MYRIIELSTLLPRERMEYFSVPPNSKKKKKELKSVNFMIYLFVKSR